MKRLTLVIASILVAFISANAQYKMVVETVDGQISDLCTSDIKSVTCQYANNEAVDLGLSVKWATCNVGANSPEEYGDYFAWGETQSKSNYSGRTYKYCNGSSSSMTKYCTSSSDGTVDNKTTLELSDDAANANWGGDWRMPTATEIQELLDSCTWT